MSFVSFVDKVYPIKKMPRWLVRSYEIIVKKWRTFSESRHCLHPTRCTWRIVKKRGKYTYTVITAVYNTSKYLDDYFRSITRQSLDFKKHIQLILVDDGSTDNSAAIIRKWQKSFPANITYVYQQNQGAGCARNAGLALAKNQWVCMIDSDDVVHPDYFYQADRVLQKYAGANVNLLCCRQITYYEKGNKFVDDRPFRLFFAENEAIRSHNDLQDYMHFAVNSAFFSLQELQKQKIAFVDANWVSFEDGDFVLRYLGDTTRGITLFCREPIYYYRKRADQSSYIDQVWTKKEFFIDMLEEAYLGILRFYKAKNSVIPQFVQNSVLYDMSWRIKGVYYSPRRVTVLSATERERFLTLCDEIFSYIDTEVILNFSPLLSKFWYFFQIGTINCFKHEAPDCQFCYIDSHDVQKNLIRCRYYSTTLNDDKGDIYFDGKVLAPVYAKTIQRVFLERTFIYERHLWVHLPAHSEARMTFRIGDRELTVYLGGTQYKDPSVADILRYFTRVMRNVCLPTPSAPWILMDRDIQADDNAEHFYRYLAANHPTRDIYFALRKSSPDWERLQKEEFRLLDFGTPEFERTLRQAGKLISSHMDHYIVQYRPGILKGKHFVCLQHGITKHNLSHWLNSKKIDLFVTGTEAETRSIVENGSPYILSAKEVVKTGFARHDALLSLSQKARPASKNILIMPTWRDYLTGARIGKSHEKVLLPEFYSSTYAKAWLGLLGSAKLKSLVQKYGFAIQFFPHFAMQGYFKDIMIDDSITVVTHSSTRIQELFVDATMMITDYSSVAFEMAFLRKSVLYYQFDVADIYNGEHPYTKGYFDDARDGFGPVVDTEDALLDELEILLARQGAPAPQYLSRMESTFPIRDGRNCERIYSAIFNMDSPNLA